MNFDKFTTKSQEAVQAAQQAAESARHTEIAPAHLLTALLQIGLQIQHGRRLAEGMFMTRLIPCRSMAG